MFYHFTKLAPIRHTLHVQFMHSPASRLFVGLYVVLTLAPLAIALTPPLAPGAELWLEFALAIGFIALGQLAAQFGLIARFQQISQPLGIDRVMQWHTQMGLVAALIVAAHVVILVVGQPANLRLLVPFSGNTGGTTGLLALLSMLLLIALSVWRRQLKLGYEQWRVSHALLGIAVLAFAQAHVTTAGRYAFAGWKNVALWIWCAMFVAIIVYLRIVKPAFMLRRAWTVAETAREAGDTWTLVLRPDNHAGMRFAPGQFAWIKVGTSAWSASEHPFSFSSSATHPERIEFAIKELGDFTRTIGGVKAGTVTYVDGPHGSFSCDFARADRLVLIAGGIGIAPMLSMVRTRDERDDARPITLVYACSSIDRAAYYRELAERLRRPGDSLVMVLERAHEGWVGAAGYISRDVMAPIVAANSGSTLYMICGPDVMMTSVERILKSLSVPANRIGMERFNLV